MQRVVELINQNSLPLTYGSEQSAKYSRKMLGSSRFIRDIEGNDFSGWKKDATLSIHDCVNADVGDCSLEVVDRPNPYFYGN